MILGHDDMKAITATARKRKMTVFSRSERENDLHAGRACKPIYAIPTNRALCSQSLAATSFASYAGRKSAGFLPTKIRPVSPSTSGEVARNTPVSLSVGNRVIAT
jgi:hypothetical protein